MNLATADLVHCDPPGWNGSDVSAVKLIHRNPDSFVAFAQLPGDDREFQSLSSVRVASLLSLSQQLEIDGTFSINSFYRKGTRATKDLRSLNAAWCDLDFDHNGVTWQQFISEVWPLFGDALPEPSIIVRSGGGAWLLWLLKGDDDTDAPPRALSGNRRLLAAVNRKICEIVTDRVPRLNPDRSAVDLSRCFRLPGSMNLAHFRRVQFFKNGDPPPLYRLAALAQLLGVATAPRKEIRSGPRRLNAPTSSKAQPAFVTRKRDLEQIAEARGGFRAGHRNEAAFIYAATLRRLESSKAEVFEQLVKLACRPELPTHALRAIVKSVFACQYRMRAIEIARRLSVTVDEADVIGLSQIRPDFVPRKRQARRPRRTEERREELRRLLFDVDEVPTLAELSEHLAGRGFRATAATVRRDLQAIGVKTGRERRRARIDSLAA